MLDSKLAPVCNGITVATAPPVAVEAAKAPIPINIKHVLATKKQKDWHFVHVLPLLWTWLDQANIFAPVADKKPPPRARQRETPALSIVISAADDMQLHASLIL
jgi:hypothetical protein